MLDAEPDLTVVGDAGSGDEAVAISRVKQPNPDGPSDARPGRRRRHPEDPRRRPQRRVVVLTTYETDADILRTVEASAASDLLKDVTRAELAGAVRAAARGETVLAPSVAGTLVRQVRNSAPQLLSAREVEVLRLVAEGHTNADIGRALHISEATVKTHLVRAFGTLEVSDRARPSPPRWPAACSAGGLRAE